MNKVVTTLSTALAIQASLPMAATEHSTGEANTTPDSLPLQTGGHITATPSDEFAAVSGTIFSANLHTTFSISVSVPQEWNRATERRYSKLVDKEALGEITEAEEAELNALQVLRRHEANPATPDEILHRYRQKKLDAGMLDLVRRYVRFEVSPNPKKAGAR